MGEVGKSKTIDLLLQVFPDNFLASSITYRQGADSPQANSMARLNSRFVLVDNLVDGRPRPRQWGTVAATTALDRNSPVPEDRPIRNGRPTGSRFDESARQPVSRVLSAPRGKRDDHSSGTHLTMRLTRPTRAAGRERPCTYHVLCSRDITAAPIRSCSRWGLPCRPCCQGRGALLPHRFALARGTGPVLHGRFVFCGTVPGVAPAGR